MTLSDLGNIGELASGIAVVVSLLYLAVQIRHGSQISRFEAHRALSHEMASILGNIAADPELYRIWKVLTDSPDEASYDQRERFGMLLYQIFTTFSDAERFARIDSDLEYRYQAYLDRFLGYEAVQAWWSRQGEHYPDPFRSMVDARIGELRTQKK